jgi:hypothetical protein
MQTEDYTRGILTGMGWGGEDNWPRPRDLMVLKWACEQYGARLDHVAALIERSQQAVHLTLVRLRSAGLADKRRFVVGEPSWLLPTHKGLALSHLSGIPWEPSVSRLAWVAANNAARLHVQRRRPDAEWIAARRLRNESKEGRGYVRHLPDGVVLVDSQRVAIKVELKFRGEKVPPLFDELQRKYDGTLCFCTPEAMRELTPLLESASRRWPGLRLAELPDVPSAGQAGGNAAGSHARDGERARDGEEG